MVILLIALQISYLSKVRTRAAGRSGDFGNFFIVFTKSRHYGILFVKAFYGVVTAIICCAKEAPTLIVRDIECNLSCKIVKNCRIIGLNRAKKNKFCPRSV